MYSTISVLFLYQMSMIVIKVEYSENPAEFKKSDKLAMGCRESRCRKVKGQVALLLSDKYFGNTWRKGKSLNA